MAVLPGGAAHETTAERRTRDLLTAQRLATGPNATRDLLRWLARRAGLHLRIVDPTGVVRHEAGKDAEYRRRQGGSERPCYDFSIGLGAGGEQDVSQGTLHIVAHATTPDRTGVVLSDVVRLIGWAWRAERSTIHAPRPAEASPRGRGAIVRLLLGGHAFAATEVAAALGTRLPDRLVVLVVESPQEHRHAVERHVGRLWNEGIWVAPSPDRADHTVVLVPADQAPRTGIDARHGDTDGRRCPGADRVARDLVHAHGNLFVGASGVLALDEVAVGRQQALQALSVARGTVAPVARYGERVTPEELIGSPGRAWARARLASLTDYRPARRADPTARELSETLASWLLWGNRAARRLGVHRNTLSARLRVVETLLDADLGSLSVRAELSLALRNLDLPSGPGSSLEPDSAEDRDPMGPVPRLRDLLALPQVLDWAEDRLRPLLHSPFSNDLDTLRTWLAHDGRIAPTAAALDISGPGLRKRLLRVEERLGLELIGSPAARIDVWIALRVYEAREPAAGTRA
ncbi:helix-turn-helix domain-containing protein [Embleya sp. NBC_00896]|uniref:helix-turn-helix domain-containing protein n=1 Tax=Embleya sp. NBC_00896 TaxID=2975961 RepID=UPI003863CA30|nr:helix-turn-helix domain-containing protein [Embleya sp. NBC_00896]